MNFDEATINAVQLKSGFDQLYIEKVLRLLSESEEWCRLVVAHPMLQWKVLNIRKHYGLRT